MKGTMIAVALACLALGVSATLLLENRIHSPFARGEPWSTDGRGGDTLVCQSYEMNRDIQVGTAPQWKYVTNLPGGLFYASSLGETYFPGRGEKCKIEHQPKS